MLPCVSARSYHEVKARGTLLLVLAAVAAVFVMHGIAPSHDDGAPGDGGTSHSTLHHLVGAEAEGPAAAAEHSPDCEADGCSNSLGHLIEACLIALLAALVLRLHTSVNRTVGAARVGREPRGRGWHVAPLTAPPPPSLSQLCIART